MVRGRIPIHNGTPLPTLPYSSARAQIFWITCFCIPAKRISSRRPYRHLLVFSKCIEQIRLPRLQPPSASNRRFFFSSLPLWSPPVPLCSRPDSCLLVLGEQYPLMHIVSSTLTPTTTGEDTCLMTLHCWHGIHCRVQFRESLFMDGQTKRVVIRF